LSAQIFLCAKETVSPIRQKFALLNSMGEFRRFGIGSVSATIDIYRSIFAAPRGRTPICLTSEKCRQRRRQLHERAAKCLAHHPVKKFSTGLLNEKIGKTKSAAAAPNGTAARV
jgi:hypothetical protein